MTWQNPWAVDGPLIPAEAARRALFASTSGNEGVSRYNALKVKPTASPSGQVRVSEGNALILNKSGGGGGQTYSVRNDADDLIPITPTGGSVRHDLVVVRVRDPQYSPFPTPAPGTEESYTYAETYVITGVPANVRRFADLNPALYGGVAFSALELARLDIPAGSTTITSSMITDLRRLANVRAVVEVKNMPCDVSDSLNAGAGVYEVFPQGSNVDVFIPDWAVTAKVNGYIEGIRLDDGGSCKLRADILDGPASEVTNIQENPPNNPDRRVSYNFGGSIDIPAAMRGTIQKFRIVASHNSAGAAGMLKADTNSSGFIEIRLEERTE